MANYIMSRSADFTDGWTSARLRIDPVYHLEPDEVGRLRPRDTVTILDWTVGRDMSRRERVTVEKALHDSGARLLVGAGREYDWGTPKPWEHDGAVPGSALT